MTDRLPLSRGEMEVARVLWELKQGTVREVFEAFPNGRDIDFATVQTYLRRLEVKGYVQSKSAGRIKIYRARVRPQTAIRETVNDLVDRLFGGETLSLVRHLIQDRGIDGEDVTVLRKLLDELEDNNKSL